MSGTDTQDAPTTLASLPADVFHTPRVLSVRAQIPATKPHRQAQTLVLSHQGQSLEHPLLAWTI
jgi:hypothetical protein